MATEYSEIYDLFMMLQKDYTLVNLYNKSATDFNTYLQGWLLFAIVEFEEFCDQDLEDKDDVAERFNQTLSLRNKVMLSELMVKYWLAKNVQDILQVNLHLQDKDFKTFAESQNLKAKQDYYNIVQERTSQLLTNYSLRNIDWSQWGNGNFMG